MDHRGPWSGRLAPAVPAPPRRRVVTALGRSGGATVEWRLPSLRAKCCGCTGPFQGLRAGSIPVARSAKHHGEWRSLVAHPAGGRAVAGSNPVSPISESPANGRVFVVLWQVRSAHGVPTGSKLPSRLEGC